MSGPSDWEKEDKAVRIELEQTEYKGIYRIYSSNSVSNPGTIYHTGIADVTNVFCSCPGFQYRNKCKHVDAVVEFGG